MNPSKEIHLIYKEFNELSLEELYAILKLRAEVFVVEQDCPYNDLDDHDSNALHLMGYIGNDLAATTRIFDPKKYWDDYASIGRIATHPKYRQGGHGKLIVSESINKIYQRSGAKTKIKIGAQQYLLKFYQSFGFVSTGEEYLEDGIPHVYMIK